MADTPVASNVVSGKPVATGGILAAPLGTTLPTDDDTAPDAAFTQLGYVSEGGLTRNESREITDIKEWGGKTVKKAQTSFDATFQFQFLEYLNADAAKAIYGDAAVTVTPATASTGQKMSVAVDGSESPHQSWIFEMMDGLARMRIVVPDGQITETAETPFTAGDAAIRDVTIAAYPDENGVLYYEYSDDGVVTVVTARASSGSKSAAA
jgi:hypothetical protein